MDIIALICSILAVIISIVTIVVDYARDMRINTINLNSVYFDEIFKEHLIYKLPQSRRTLTISSSGKLNGTQNLINELNQIRKDSLYFCYADNEFYKGLWDRLTSLEDYIVCSEMENFSEDVKKQNFYYKIQISINDIYRYINSKQFGK